MLVFVTILIDLFFILLKVTTCTHCTTILQPASHGLSSTHVCCPVYIHGVRPAARQKFGCAAPSGFHALLGSLDVVVPLVCRVRRISPDCRRSSRSHLEQTLILVKIAFLLPFTFLHFHRALAANLDGMQSNASGWQRLQQAVRPCWWLSLGYLCSCGALHNTYNCEFLSLSTQTMARWWLCEAKLKVVFFI